MRLVKINGQVWELSCLQRGYSGNGRNVPDDIANERIVNGLDVSDVTRILSGRKVRSKALALVEIYVNGLPQQYEYEIYLGSKGFYCNIQGKRVQLNELLSK